MGGEPVRRGRGAGTPLEAGVPGSEWGWAAPLVPTPASVLPPPCQCQGQTPASLALSRPLGSPCRRFWSESERKAGRGPPLRKIMASRPRKSALRPVYSSPPRVRVGSGEEGQALYPDPISSQ